jgi:carboxymethylenebutenolidase
MTGTRVDVSTAEGVIDCYLFTPDGAGPWPAIVVYMDAFGIRPELGEMTQRLASNGYVVALPNLYYRSGSFLPFDKRAVMADGPERDRFKGMIQSITSAMVMRDTAAVIAMLDARPDVRAGAMGALGYCMGGGYALAAAGTFPDRVAAAASFHGGSLATEKPDSPHTFAGRMRAKVYVGAAEIDPSFPAEQKARLERALTEAGVDHAIETYAGAKHGFAVNGHLVYDHDASERHWTAVQSLFAETLR